LPIKSDYEKTQEIILCTFGGSSGHYNDEIADLAKNIIEINQTYEDKIYYWYGVQTSGNDPYIAWKINKIYEKMVGNGKTPKIILVGKSLGGCILHKVHERLKEKNRDIDLFIGVDMSCWVACHYKKYNENPDDNKNQLLVFKNNVKDLINFYQIDYRSGTHQCGHPAKFDGKSLDEEKININVKTRKYDMTNKVGVSKIAKRGITCENLDILDPIFHESTFEGGKRVDKYSIIFKYKCGYNNYYDLCDDNVTHMTIDQDTNLIDLITLLVRKKINIDYEDRVENPKYTFSYTNPTGSDSGTYDVKEIRLGEHQEEVMVHFKINPTENDAYKRTVKITLNDLNSNNKSKPIELSQPFICLTPYVGLVPSSNDCLGQLRYVNEGIVVYTDKQEPHDTMPTPYIGVLVIDNSPSELLNKLIDYNKFGNLLNRIKELGVESKIFDKVKSPLDHCNTTIKWGYINGPIKCKIKERRLYNVITRKVTIEKSVRGQSFGHLMTKNIDKTEMNDFELCPKFSKRDYDEQTRLKFTFYSEDSIGQKAEATLILYAKCLIHKETCSQAIIIDNEIDRLIQIDNLIPLLAKELIDGLNPTDSMIVKNNLNIFNKNLREQVKNLTTKIIDEKEFTDKMNYVISIEVKRIIEDCDSIQDTAKDIVDVRKISAYRYIDGFFNIKEEITSELISTLKNELKNISPKIIKTLNKKGKR